jgi:ABC-2 type transport system ATP-binding protein
MTTTALSVEGLTKRYGNRTAVEALDLELPTGVVAGFVGPNGAGKTTTMAMLLGLVKPTAGNGTVLGRPLRQPAAYLGDVGALIEAPAFYGALTGVENLTMFAAAGRHDRGRIPALLDLVGLADRGDDRYRSYSLGMKQRLGIAAALLGDPKLLILDEPSNGLDPQGMREMRAIIGRVASAERTVLVSSHVLSELEQVCNWLVLIDAGRSLYQGPANQFLDGAATSLTVAPQEPAHVGPLADLITGTGTGNRVERGNGRLHVTVEDPARAAAAINQAAFAAGIVLVELTPSRSSLEDRYLSMIEGGSR